jgi:LacI family transcriptional regulator
MKKPSIYDIAKKVNVSSATVSYVLNGKDGKVSEATKKRIYQAMEELGYTRDHAAVSLSTGKSHLIGIVLPLNATSEAFFNNPFYGEFLGAFDEVLQEKGYDVIICSSKSVASFERWYRSRALDGVVVLGSLSQEMEKSLCRLNALAVLVDVYEEYSAPFTNIRINDENGEYSATCHLIGLGHKNIGYLGGPDNSIVNHRRYCGYEKALLENDLPIKKELVFHTLTTFDGGYALGEKIKERLGRMSAVVVDADIIAIGLIRRLLELGVSLPDELSIVGFDDIQPAQYIHPALSTVHQDIREKGALSAKTILDEIANKPLSKKTFVIEPSVKARQSAIKAKI